MWNASLKFAMVLLFAVNIQSLELAAEPRDPKSTIQELAELTTDMTRFAAFGHSIRMLRCGPPMQPFVLSAAFCRLKRRSADKAFKVA